VPDLSFQVEKAAPLAYAAAPQLLFTLRITEAESPSPTPIQSILLRCQIRIEPLRRRYEREDPERFRNLFGDRGDWGRTMQSMLWSHAQVVVPPFCGTVAVDLPVPCTYDFNVAATQYFAGLEDGEVPLNLLFSGSIFYEAEGRGLQVVQIPWDRECRHRLPVSVWKEMMDQYYPNRVWLALGRDLFERLSQYKSRRGLPTWEHALGELLEAVDRERQQVPT
jgi:hypothetical protein